MTYYGGKEMAEAFPRPVGEADDRLDQLPVGELVAALTLEFDVEGLACSEQGAKVVWSHGIASPVRRRVKIVAPV